MKKIFMLTSILLALRCDARLRNSRVLSAGIRRGNAGQSFTNRLDLEVRLQVPSQAAAMPMTRNLESVPEMHNRKEKMRLAMLQMFGLRP